MWDFNPAEPHMLFSWSGATSRVEDLHCCHDLPVICWKPLNAPRHECQSELGDPLEKVRFFTLLFVHNHSSILALTTRCSTSPSMPLARLIIHCFIQETAIVQTFRRLKFIMRICVAFIKQATCIPLCVPLVLCVVCRNRSSAFFSSQLTRDNGNTGLWQSRLNGWVISVVNL